MLAAQDRGEQIDRVAFEARVREAVKEVVQRQTSCGIDVVNDGEMSKISYSTYVKDRLTGFDDRTALSPSLRLDLPEFPGFAKRVGAVLLDYARPACTGPISYRGQADVARDIANLQAAVEGAHVTEVFMTAASPGVISLFLANQYYPTHEAYLSALAEAMKEEYDAISQAGFLVQLDCPDLAVGLSGTDGANVPLLHLHLQALNHAVRDIPPDRLRLHLCWGNYEGPHHRDVRLLGSKWLWISPVLATWDIRSEIRHLESDLLVPFCLQERSGTGRIREHVRDSRRSLQRRLP
jgi:5-methyltetrahydropteroyltriglutamate--homocysteine methyltransferase